MRVLVCGGRDFTDRKRAYVVLDAAHAHTPISVLIHGGARGADSLGHDWAISRGVRVLRFPANWEEHGKAAGPIRNQRMLVEGKPDIVAAFPGGRGTAHMVSIAQKAGVPTIDITPQDIT